ncbi:putative hydrolase of the HAD superfamily [Fistulifera solaris]|uniref:Putative hydrolase of the HAD superfamily n=1 Tax=Fistulifera solaris TaxID=1519565 RepID=A0A1Z5KGI5_FISSO|nr:putative hydrolase of the HAD superfamily [Fistulifera solaris]|eukprot:GAX25424.1 putative hydrolase of the HAD superfamily [Fistulifera solaris]
MLDITLFSLSTILAVFWSRRELSSHETLDAEERVCLVTPDNQVVSGGARRQDMRKQNLWHRATYILVKHRPTDLEYHDEDFVLVQKRSMRKDYCPGKLDPTPGGVVGHNESYRENAEREIHEEMGISINENNSLDRLFTFAYHDDRVKVWGDFYECTFTGKMRDLRLQSSEVEDCYRMSLRELYQRIQDTPDDFMPDACHALRLYFQRKLDIRADRRLLVGCSSSNLDNYGLRPRPLAIFFDCDDCLYFDDWKTANRLTKKIDDYCVQKLGLPEGKAYELYKNYGTCLKGLLAEEYLDKSEIDSFLEAVHDIPLEFPRDDVLRSMLLDLDPTIPKYIFTASVWHHAHRCLQQLGIDDLFPVERIIDCKCCDLETKHSPHSFRRAMAIAGVRDASRCLLLDDNLSNLEAARREGWQKVLVGNKGRDCGNPISSPHAELQIETIHHLKEAMPELFVDARAYCSFRIPTLQPLK